MLSQTDIQGLRDAGMPDDEILNALQGDPSVNGDINGLKAHGVPSTDILNNFDKLHPKKSGFGDALQYGSAKALEGVGRTLQSFDATKDWGDRAMQAGQSFDNEQDYSPAGSQVGLNPSTWGNIPRALVEAVPGAAASIAGGAAGAVAGGAVGGPVGATLGGIAGAGLGGVPSYMGDRLQNRLLNNGQTNTPLSDASTLDKLIAGGTAFGEGALNRVGVGGALAGTVKSAGLPALAQLPYQIGKAGLVGGGASAAGDALTQAGDTIGTDKGLTVNPNEVGSAAITGYGGGALARGAKGIVQDIPQAARFATVAQMPEAARDVANILQDTGENLSDSKGAYKALKSATDTLSNEAADNAKTLKANNAVDPDAATLIDAALKQLDKGNTLSTDEMQAVANTLQKVAGADDLVDSIKRYQVLNEVKSKGRVDDSSKTVTGGFNAGILGDLTNPIGAVARRSPTAALAMAAGGSYPIGEAALHAVQHGGIEALSGVAGLAPVIGALMAGKLGLRGIDAATGFSAPVGQFASRFAQPGPNQILVSAAQASQARQALQNAPQGATAAPQPTLPQLAQAAQARAQALAALHGQGQAQAAPAAPTAAPQPAPAPAPAFTPQTLGSTTPTARFGQLGSLGDDRGVLARLSAPQVTADLGADAPATLNGEGKPNGSANGTAQTNGTQAPAGDSFTYHGIEFPIPPDVKYRPGYIKSLKRNQDLINTTLDKEVYGDTGAIDQKTFDAIEANRVALKTARNQDDARGVVNRIIKQAHPDDRAQLRNTFDETFFKTWRKKSQGEK
jgi:hypothetical protein